MPGDQMWKGDSVQIGIDPHSAQAGSEGAQIPFELGFSVPPAGKIFAYAWSGNIDFSTTILRGERSATGWRISAEIPWRSILLDPASLPESFGVNVVVNSGDGQGRREVLQWTAGLADRKDSREFARVHLVPGGKETLSFLRVAKNSFDRKDVIEGRFVTYNLKPTDRKDVRLGIEGGGASSLVVSEDVSLPASLPMQTKTIDFEVPASLLSGVGRYTAFCAGDVVSRVLRMFSIEDSAAQIEELKNALQKRAVALRSEVAASKFEDDAYTRLALSILERFQKQFDTEQGTEEWARLQLSECLQVIDEAEAHIARGRTFSNLDPRQTVRPTVKSGLLLGAPQDSGDTTAPGRPVLLSGYLGWGSVLRDLEVLGDFGVSLVQVEKGPNQMSEQFTLTDGADGIGEMITRANASGLMVDLLLSPHYFPDWAVRKDPDVVFNEATGWTKFSITHPAAQKVIASWLRQVVPLVKELPGLFAFCLSNEPTYSWSGRDPHSKPEWTAFLQRKHGTIESLNQLYATKYGSFGEVTVPPLGMPEGGAAKRAYYDWIRFNQEFFAGWHRWMNDIVKGLAPEIPTHAKIMCNIFDPTTLANGIDPELICDITDLAGNDCWSYPGAYHEYAYNWRLEEMWYDLLHSFRSQPVYNSENHIIPDGMPAVSVPQGHVRTVLWQGALHHQAATTVWVWEKPSNRDLAGSIYLRPASLYESGRTMLDLVRLAPEIGAVAAAKTNVAILYSIPSIFWQPDYLQTLASVYTALTLSGKSVTFVSEKQIREGRLAAADNGIQFVVLPSATHVEDTTRIGLAEFGKSRGTVLAVGNGNLEFDQYNRPRQAEAAAVRTFAVPRRSGKDRILRDDLLSAMKINDSEIVITDAATGKAPWGVQWRVVPFKGGHLVSLTNLLAQPVALQIHASGEAVDLLNSVPQDLSHVQLDPRSPKLLHILNEKKQNN